MSGREPCNVPQSQGETIDINDLNFPELIGDAEVLLQKLAEENQADLSKGIDEFCENAMQEFQEYCIKNGIDWDKL
ncbi:hypothetical protein [Candidatus Kuenenia sp.]|uniref:hypothetical protein n=1 Tax=Candidatus Kuenenia sp. TaxID=2499824 RepID=UPI00321FEDE7